MEWTDEVWKFTELNGREIMVSSYGRVIGFKGRVIKPQLMQTGYYVFKYWNGRHVANIEIHRLVAKAFIPNPENKPEVDHIDTVRTNNHVNNLRWVTRSENHRNPLTVKRRSEARKGLKMSDETRRRMSESKKKTSKELSERSSKAVFVFDLSGILIDEFKSVKEACIQLGITEDGAYRCVRNKKKSHRGYMFKYKEDVV